MSYDQYAGSSAPYPPPGQPGYPPPAQGLPYPPPEGQYPPPGGAPLGFNPPPYPPAEGGYPAPYPPAGHPPPLQGGQPLPYSSSGYTSYTSGPQGPITQPPMPYGQPPGQGVPMLPGPNVMPGVPPGLEYMTAIDQLIIKQKVELLESLTGWETNNKYTVRNSMGQTIFEASEKTDCCTRNCCGPSRPFDMKIKDSQGREVVHLYRPLRCTSCFFPCFLQRVEVCSPPGNVIGYVCQEWSICSPSFTIRDQQENVVLSIEGPCCTFSICGDVEFQVLAPNGAQIGRISKQWSGLLREAFTDADNFGISFPLDLHVHVKATLMAAAFLIDFMFFEKKGNRENDRMGMFD